MVHKLMTSKHVSRRSFVQTTVAATAGAVTIFRGSNLESSPRALQTTLSPEQAVNALIDGNQRFTSGTTTAHEHDLGVLRAKAADKQQPFAAVLACADSRVPVELVFDQTIGQLFVCRVAGNMTTPEITASLEYAAAELGIRAILVLGHSHCGAVEATIKGSTVPGQISALFPRIRPAVDRAGPHISRAARRTPGFTARFWPECIPVIAGLVKSNNIKVVAGYYDVTTGIATLLK